MIYEEYINEGLLQKKIISNLEDMLNQDWKVTVESLIDRKYNKKDGFYLHAGAVGKVVKAEYVPAIKEEDDSYYLVYIEWFKNKIVPYAFGWWFEEVIEYYEDLKSSVGVKEIIPPKNPNQLELF